MSLTKFSVDHRPVVLTGVVIALLVGISTFLTMSRREDPEILIRTCIISTRWPGAKATKVEDLVTDPLEDAIQQIDEVEEIRSQSRVGYSLIEVDIDERLWDSPSSSTRYATRSMRYVPSCPRAAECPM